MNDLLQVVREMRERKVNHGQDHSPTIHAWADRIEKAANTMPEWIVVRSPQEDPRWFMAARRVYDKRLGGYTIYETVDPMSPYPTGDKRSRISDALDYLEERFTVRPADDPSDLSEWATGLYRILLGADEA